MVKKLFALFAISQLSSCTSQQVNSTIPKEEIELLTTNSTVKPCTDQINILKNRQEYVAYLSESELENNGKSAPIMKVDFETKNVAVVCKENIDNFEIEKIKVKKNRNQLYLSKIENKNSQSSTNIQLITVPKTIDHLILKN